MDDLEGIPKPGNWLPVLLLAFVILPIVMCLSSHRSVGGIGAMLDTTEGTVVACDRDSCSFTLSDVTGCLKEAGFAEDGEIVIYLEGSQHFNEMYDAVPRGSHVRVTHFRPGTSSSFSAEHPQAYQVSLFDQDVLSE